MNSKPYTTTMAGKRTSKSSEAANTKKQKTENDKEVHWTLNDSGKKRVTLSEFRGTTYVHIREYYEKDGEMLPGKKGIALNPNEWMQFKRMVGEVTSALGLVDEDEDEDEKKEEKDSSETAKNDEQESSDAKDESKQGEGSKEEDQSASEEEE
ncbi:transcription coactivator PC4 [Schizosaccharomyces cryophilus OY26]|uniref:Transcription coactivator PC4 n=1 Tax=Schizosaccharomyces cryophilus (strain OY26 / ATCC MYA-4695 / CBS 11777 / NBRC 106824 / NRRL Y48691) TaxID=653667 RepID=S9XI73_SCHCR|nr:transcription coactivator PC4 [Schizosaccharomyces cryophilus OY26]EPY53346.1 transcription coactivator PC4 [Schizosaccharomyces cryophilus OY26]